ncbi:protein stum homolog isoform X2 [Gigantopelta aegis]|uniref:protein stum homolog isoform X2 n=1 Tax=Gigantopelta aegis TaxID=1735272 RepID=UPI001B88C916|nr:protein stum homolog isoform X2 [Gigantopelta aegis]
MATARDDVKTSLTGQHNHKKNVHISEERAEIIEIVEKHGPLYNAIPCMPLPVAVFCCVFNIVIPGFGTLISAFTVLCGAKTKFQSTCTALGLNILTALLQMASFIIIVGWVWSIIWGMNFVQISMPTSDSQRIPYYVRRQSSVE